MASKQKMIEQKLREIEQLKAHITVLETQIETGRLYRMTENRLCPEGTNSSWVIPIRFNNNDVCFEVVASELITYSEEKNGWRGRRQDLTTLSYHLLSERLVRVKKDELPLLLGLPFVSSRLEKIMHGTARVKLD